MADWSNALGHIAKHGITVAMAEEALADEAAVVLNPDDRGLSGQGIRTIGYSPTCKSVVSVITVERDGVVYGASAWRSNSRDNRNYQEGKS